MKTELQIVALAYLKDRIPQSFRSDEEMESLALAGKSSTYDAFLAGYEHGEFELHKKYIIEIQKLRIVAEQLNRWRNAWAGQDRSDCDPARRAMFKALDYWLDNEGRTENETT